MQFSDQIIKIPPWIMMVKPEQTVNALNCAQFYITSICLH